MEQLRLLIVDDEEDFASVLAQRLEFRGFQVETAGSGSDALARVAAKAFHVLVLDVKMPGIDGLDLMAQIRAKHACLPVILLTGHGSAAGADRGMKEGAFDYLMKPVDIDELIEKIRKAAGTGKVEPA